jgi:ribosome-binding protein aMBF1 (putative translation factor)
MAFTSESEVEMANKTIIRGGKRFVLVREDEYQRLVEAAQGPQLPASDSEGARPAVPFARAVIAQSIIRDRLALGWSQAELARQARINVETLNRIERGKVTPDTATIAKLDAALKRGGKVVKTRRSA